MTNKVNDDYVPILTRVEDERLLRIGKDFTTEFDEKPDFYVRVPGRVNIIGEHIDYCGYPVLPMALELDILIAAKITKEKQIKLRNANEKYISYERKISTFEEIKIEPDINGKPFWYNYVLCGIKGALEYLQNNFKNGVIMYVDGNIPPASGLSSSSALVSASCLAFLQSQNITPKKSEIAALCAESERYIGTQGGGMDQAIAFLAQKNCAQFITWNPLRALPVSLPDDATFVVTHSLAEANKAATNDFNRRVIECRLAAKLLSHYLGTNFDSNIITLSQVQIASGKSLEEMVKLVSEYIPQSLYTKDEICSILDISDNELSERYLTPNTKYLKEFKLQQRALHVYEEAIRVEKFRNACMQYSSTSNTKVKIANGNSIANGDAKLFETLGSLMSESHQSLKELYECSHDNLDRLVKLSKDLNIHCRLTGAGWGGCAVALCPKSDVNIYVDKLRKEFYEKYCNLDSNQSKQYIFATKPNHGAVIYIT